MEIIIDLDLACGSAQQTVRPEVTNGPFFLHKGTNQER
jgi:hypothetical protein